MKRKRILITGAGLAGSLLGINLARRGCDVEIYERRPDMRQNIMSAGRSINLALSARGIYALDQVGLADAILQEAIPMAGRMMHSPDGTLTFQPYGKNENEVINSISRSGINCTLMNAAEEAGVAIRFRQRCLDIDFDNSELRFLNEETGEHYTISADTVIACDGATSPVRLEMQKTGRFNLHQSYLEHGYKELTIPAGEGGRFQMDEHALHIWPRGTYMLIALPNPDASFTCTLFLPYAGDPGFDNLTGPERVRSFFSEQFTDALELMPDLETMFFENPTGNLITIKCHPWHIGGKALLLGDSAHAIVPFYGQGMNCAFEDCAIFADCVDEHGDDWETVFESYQRRRKEDADAIADLALNNFVEMRDSVADPVFLMKKRLELQLENEYPERFLSTYAMVTFHRVSYARALRQGAIQEKVLMNICRDVASLDDIDTAQALKAVEAAVSAEMDS